VARAFHATEYNKGLKTGQFMNTKELKIQLESMDRLRNGNGPNYARK
jgi:hypothetical protein